MGLSLWLPPSAREREEPRRVLRCMVPGCGRRFPDTHRGQFERHVSACAKRNMDRIQEETAIRESDPFTSVGDKEQYSWVRKLASVVGPTEANKRLRRGRRRRK
jgi:hypothetical protein